ncbi:MAG TPA: GNAT family N-acetyltransferase [Gemmatimonadaceae bacterium]
MRHELRVEGAFVRLRPIRVEDAPFVAELRGAPERAKHLHRGDTSVEAQERWLRAYEDRAGDYYFVIERVADAGPEGLVGIYDVTDREAEWGRWILRPGSLAAAESALLTYRCAFEGLGLPELYCRTLARNASVVSFHDSAGARRAGVLPAHFEIDGERLDAVEHRVGAGEWPGVRERLGRIAEAVAMRARRAERVERAGTP